MSPWDYSSLQCYFLQTETDVGTLVVVCILTTGNIVHVEVYPGCFGEMSAISKGRNGSDKVKLQSQHPSISCTYPAVLSEFFFHTWSNWDWGTQRVRSLEVEEEDVYSSGVY